MEYLALYRKYRPSFLGEMVGQNEIRKIISNSIKNNTISHAYLFSGPRGTGKTTTAKIMAKMVNCEHLVDDSPCEVCDSCKSINSNVDVIEIDAASNNGVDEIRDLREKANLVPGTCKYKVYIIDEVHMLTNQAFNALLKTLEEPPKHVIFILATTEYYKIPSTITSRCQKFQFNKIEIVDIVKKLREIANKENISITDDALNEIAKISDGGMRDSINFLDQLRSFSQGNISIEDVYEVCGNVSNQSITEMFINLKNNELENVVSFLENLGNNGKSYSKFLEDLMIFLKDLILYKKGVSSSLIRTDVSYLDVISELYSYDDIFYIIDVINDLLDKIKFVSRQSVVIISNFLIISNKICVKSDCIVDEGEKISFKEKIESFTSNDEDNELIDNVNENIIDDSNKNEINNNSFINQDIIVNNAFALADKNSKITLQKKWSKITDYLTDNHYGKVSGKWTDVSLEVVGGNYIIFVSLYDSVIESIYSDKRISDDFINNVLDGRYEYVIINNNEWNIKKNEYINNIKNGIKYEIKELIKENNPIEKIAESTTIVDKLFSLVGEENIEFK